MSEELLKVFRNRPVVVNVDGGYVYVSIKDQEFWRQRKVLKARLRSTHPDRGGTSTAFMRVNQIYRMWQYKQTLAYGALGLDPPLVVVVKAKLRYGPTHALPELKMCPACRLPFSPRRPEQVTCRYACKSAAMRGKPRNYVGQNQNR